MHRFYFPYSHLMAMPLKYGQWAFPTISFPFSLHHRSSQFLHSTMRSQRRRLRRRLFTLDPFQFWESDPSKMVRRGCNKVHGKTASFDNWEVERTQKTDNVKRGSTRSGERSGAEEKCRGGLVQSMRVGNLWRIIGSLSSVGLSRPRPPPTCFPRWLEGVPKKM